MRPPFDIPNDENGDVLRQMLSHGDDLSKPRMIDFSHLFPDRKRALLFAEKVDDRDLTVCISFYEDEQNRWDVTVSRYMVPTHADITALELRFAKIAESVGGYADGWGALNVKNKKQEHS